MKAVAANFVRVEVINSVRAVISPGGFFAEAAGVGDSFAATDDFSWLENCSVVLARALSLVEQEMFSYLTLSCCRLLPELVRPHQPDCAHSRGQPCSQAV